MAEQIKETMLLRLLIHMRYISINALFLMRLLDFLYRFLFVGADFVSTLLCCITD